MTAPAIRRSRTDGSLRVIEGHRLRRPTVAPWMVMALIGVVSFLGLGFARTSLDRSAFELAELNAEIEAQLDINQELELEIARLENPARIAPLALEMGMVIPADTNQLLVDLDTAPVVAETDGSGESRG
jgi:cell division protein FtsL